MNGKRKYGFNFALGAIGALCNLTVPTSTG